LGGVASGGRRGEIAARFGDARGAVANPEHAVGFQVEIARSAPAGVGSMQILALFDVEPDRRLVFLEHAGVHRKGELLALRLQGSGERGKRAVGPAVGPFPEQPDVFVARIERADGELRAVEVFWSAGGDGRPSASANETKENSQS